MTDPTHTPLSPAAQAGKLILAYRKGADEVPHPLGLAAALNAVADQVVPAASPRDRASWSPFAGQIRADILAIAAELEGQVNA